MFIVKSIYEECSTLVWGANLYLKTIILDTYFFNLTVLFRGFHHSSEVNKYTKYKSFLNNKRLRVRERYYKSRTCT